MPVAWSVAATGAEAEEAVGRARGDDIESFVLGAVERNNAAFEARCLEEDCKAGERHGSGCWHFASELKGHPFFELAESWEVVEVVERTFSEAGLSWSTLPCEDVWANESDPRNDFINCWSCIREPLALVFRPDAALPLAEEWPLEASHWSSPADERYRRAVALCFWFARLLDADGRFFLSCRTLGELIDTSHPTAASYLRRARREGLLEVLQPGRQGKAARFRFRLDAVVYASDEAVAPTAVGWEAGGSALSGVRRC